MLTEIFVAHLVNSADIMMTKNNQMLLTEVNTVANESKAK